MIRMNRIIQKFKNWIVPEHADLLKEYENLHIRLSELEENYRKAMFDKKMAYDLLSKNII